jgi:hypothetical protein
LGNLGKFSGNLGWMNRCLKEEFKGVKTTEWASLVGDFRKFRIRIFSGHSFSQEFGNGVFEFFWVKICVQGIFLLLQT